MARSLTVVMLVAAGIGSANRARAATEQVRVIPAPQHLAMGQGTFTLRDGLSVSAPRNARAQWIANFLRKKVLAETDVDLKMADGTRPASIRLEIKPGIKGEDAYHLTVASDGVTLVAHDDRGLFWGVQTLRQLLPLHSGKAVLLPAVDIKDAPHYQWRGMMLDVSRHFYPVSFIKKQIALMSYYKFNVFHWHLTDDQGWRIQINKYPRLTGVGAWRTTDKGKRYGGFYTQRQIREVVAYAKKRNVMVVPEIELPGHANAAIAAYPDLSCNNVHIEVPATWGVLNHVDCVAKPSTYKFLENVLDEVVKLFPSPYVHIGGDEVPPGAWTDCAACQKLAEAHDLKGEAGLHSYFIRKIQKYLASKGKTMIGWSEIMQGGMDPGAIVEEWLGPKGTEKALANGNRIIVAGPFYLSQAISGMTLQDLYRKDPLTGPPYTQHADLVLGGEAALWSEAATPMNASARLYPRLLAIAEHLWNPGADNWENFRRRVTAQETWLASQNVAYGPADKDLIDYRLSFNSRFHRWRIRALRGFADEHVRYTGSDEGPTSSSAAFDDVLDLYAPGVITMAPFRAQRQLQRAETFHFSGGVALGKPVTYEVPPTEPYSRTLTDGISGDPYQKRGWKRTWARWYGKTEVAVVDLGHEMPIHKIVAGYLGDGRHIFLPQSVRFAISSDKQTWHTVYSASLHPERQAGHRIHRTATYHFPHAASARYVRVTAQPFTGSAQGKHTLMFSDVISVY